MLKNNEKVLKAQKVLERAKANLQTARSVYLPQIGLTGYYERRKNDDLDSDERDYLSGVSLSQVLARFGEVPQDLDLAQESVRKSGIELESTKQDVIFTLRRLWHNIALTEEGDSTTKRYCDHIAGKTPSCQEEAYGKENPYPQCIEHGVGIGRAAVGAERIETEVGYRQSGTDSFDRFGPIVNRSPLRRHTG